MNTKIILLYAAPLGLLLNTAPASFAVDSQTTGSNTIDSQQIEQLKAKYFRQEQDDLDKAVNDADRQVENVDRQADKDVSLVPKYLYSSPNLSAQNADYDAMVSEIRTKERAQIKDIYYKSLEQQGMIKEAYEQKINDLVRPQTVALKATELKLASAKHIL